MNRRHTGVIGGQQFDGERNRPIGSARWVGYQAVAQPSEGAHRPMACTEWRTTMMKTLAEVARISQGLSLSGRGAGAHPGDWELQMVESGDVEDDGWLSLAGLKEITIARNARTERHLLRPYDVLLTARTGSSHAVLAPPEVSRTVAGVTLLVVRPRGVEWGMGHWLWYYLTSTEGS